MKKLLTCVFVLGLAACNDVDSWTIAQADDLEGAVEISYKIRSSRIEVAPHKTPKQIVNIANELCHNWGYDHVEKHDGALGKCQTESNHGCNVWQINQRFVCI